MEYNLNYELIGVRIRDCRLKAKITQEVLAEKAGVTPHHISSIENNKTQLSLPCLVAIANALNTTTDHLLMDNVMTASMPHLMGEVKIIFDDYTPEELFIFAEMAKSFKKSMKTKNLQIIEK